MAAESYKRRLQDEVTCPVCLEYFVDPVTLDCGHNFCRGCITKCWGDSPTDAACPQCRERVQTSSLRPNRQLGSMVELVKELSELPRLEASGWRVCKRHQEPLKLFCQDDQAPICVVCDRSKEHQAHHVVPLEEAAQEVQDEISRSLEVLRKERENILVYKAENEKESRELLKQMEAEREKTVATLRQVRQFLEEQEKLLLTRTEEVEKEIVRRRDEHLARLSRELSSLDYLIQEMEKKQQQSASELLQNIRTILERGQKESFDNPVAFPASLKWKIYDFCEINSFLETLMKQFRDFLVSDLQLQEANVTLDPDTAYPQLILSEDCKSVRWGPRYQTLPNNPKRFESPFVLGREGFTTGRHFWEVTVGSEEQWALGVARSSVTRKYNCSLDQDSWGLGKSGGKYFVNNPPDYSPLSLSQEPKRIRVTLNCVERRVAFFDADTVTQLYVYSDVSFCGKILLPIFFVSEGGHLTICP
ncbi:zinc finger protein RFP-like [Tiliqua scincoides]|uniref:zinc finger protein RFP-like n=1 Tax=Tiliqua scincoides TaxID=71010 RepID=UPI0034626201